MDWDHTSTPSPTMMTPSNQPAVNSTRNEKVPTLKQIMPSPSVTALSKMSDDELRRKGKEELLALLRGLESDYKGVLSQHAGVVREVNRRYQIFVLETRQLKEANQRIQEDNQELRDLCCFLDDDRQRGRKLAREWQRFGRYTASVMRSEVSVYQEKLQELENRQAELAKENVELKELCLFLDGERGGGHRDDGDGSSNGTTTGPEDLRDIDQGTYTTGSSNYLHDLEQKVMRLEEEKRLMGKWLQGMNNSPISSDGKKPDTVMDAMKVLQVHEDLEKTPTPEVNWDDTEKAVLREMCNVVWRKLGDVGVDIGTFNDSSDSLLDPPPDHGHNYSNIISHNSNMTSSASNMTSHPSNMTSHSSNMTSHPSSMTSHPPSGTHNPSNFKPHPSMGAHNSNLNQRNQHSDMTTSYPPNLNSYSNMTSNSSNMPPHSSNITSHQNNPHPTHATAHPQNMAFNPSKMTSHPHMMPHPSNMTSRSSNMVVRPSNMTSRPSNMTSHVTNMTSHPTNATAHGTSHPHVASHPPHMSSHPSQHPNKPQPYYQNQVQRPTSPTKAYQQHGGDASIPPHFLPHKRAPGPRLLDAPGIHQPGQTHWQHKPPGGPPTQKSPQHRPSQSRSYSQVTPVMSRSPASWNKQDYDAYDSDSL